MSIRNRPLIFMIICGLSSQDISEVKCIFRAKGLLLPAAGGLTGENYQETSFHLVIKSTDSTMVPGSFFCSVSGVGSRS
jgi:hypothetical protein